ncbi:MAG TPA: hypothetical protein VFX87_09895 [Methylomirabilota bacterium]|nr:hypothetical protein [Methylomirabilota bacterium]
MGYEHLVNTLKAIAITAPAARAFEPIRHGQNSWYEVLAGLEP